MMKMLCVFSGFSFKEHDNFRKLKAVYPEKNGSLLGLICDVHMTV